MSLPNATTSAPTTTTSAPTATTPARPGAAALTTAAPPAAPTIPADEVVVRRLLAAIVDRDEATLFELFAPDLWFRALLVHELVEHHDAVAALAMFRGWFGRGIPVEVLHTATYPVASRQYLSYRFRLQPEWAPDVWHVIEQSGYVRVREGRIARLDLVCTGFFPEA
jgi:hypothetical protein